MGDPGFSVIAAELDVYCPFEALGAARQEIRHSNFLANLLTATNPHGFGDEGLRAFLDTMLLSIGDDRTRLQLHLGDLGQCEIRREWQHIDLICSLADLSPPLVVAVEIKVESGEHGDQLSTYEKAVADEWPDSRKLYFYLTPNGADASRKDWNAVSFADLLIGLEPLLRQGKAVPAAAMLLRAYIDMMRRRYVPNDHLEELARQIWAKHASTLDYLIDQRPDVMRDASTIMRENEFDDISKAVRDATGIEIELEKSSNTYLQISVPKWDSNPSMLHSTWTATKRLLLCQIEFYGNRVHARMLMGQGDTAARDQLMKQLMDCPGVDYGKKKSLTPKWSRLASRTLMIGKEIDEIRESNDVALMVEKSKKGIIEFLVKHLPAYDRALA
jgi:PD-(D/E)XK nuclease superfamily